MAFIRPSADLRNNYNEISRICHETKEPIFITRNGTSDLVILSDEAYETMLESNKESEEDRINKLVSEHFNKYYNTLEEFKKDISNKVNKALKEIEEGKGRSLEDFCAEMEEKYDIQR